MKMKGAAIGTAITVAALGVIGSLGTSDIAADPAVTGAYTDTDTYAIIETVDFVTETVDIITQDVVTTQAVVTEPPKPVTTAPETEPPKPVTTAPETEPPKQVTPPPVVTETPAQVLDIISVTNPVECGAMATLTAKGKPGVEYDIIVVYSSGASKANGLDNAFADANGNVSWTWKVGAKTKPGTYTITVKGGSEEDTIDFTVYE